MVELIVSVTLVLVLVSAAAMVAMIIVGLTGIISGSRVVVGCPQCGRWRLEKAARSQAVCMHCAHPDRFAWEPSLLHPRRTRPH
jgi:hypothetical protein